MTLPNHIDELIEKLDSEIFAQDCFVREPNDAYFLGEVRNALSTLQERNRKLEEALKPFAAVVPSSLYPGDGSEAEEYVVTLRGCFSNQPEFTGADLARARALLSGAGE